MNPLSPETLVKLIHTMEPSELAGAIARLEQALSHAQAEELHYLRGQINAARAAGKHWGLSQVKQLISKEITRLEQYNAKIR